MAAHDPAGARAGAVPGEALLATVVTGYHRTVTTCDAGT